MKFISVIFILLSINISGCSQNLGNFKVKKYTFANTKQVKETVYADVKNSSKKASSGAIKNMQKDLLNSITTSASKSDPLLSKHAQPFLIIEYGGSFIDRANNKKYLVSPRMFYCRSMKPVRNSILYSNHVSGVVVYNSYDENNLFLKDLSESGGLCIKISGSRFMGNSVSSKVVKVF